MKRLLALLCAAFWLGCGIPGMAAEESAVYGAYFDRGTTRTFTVFAEASGAYALRIIGGMGESAVDVNGLPQGTATLAGGDFPVALRKGINTVRFADGLAVEAVELIGAGQPEAVGASVPFRTYEVEAMLFQGELLAGDRTYRTVTSEASGRACVKLSQAGDSVEWTLQEPANALVLRACAPDTPEGTGLQTYLALYADGVRLDDVQLSSRHTWLYGSFPWTNDPADGNAHVFFDDVRVRLGTDYPAGTVLRLAWEAPAEAAYSIVDLVDTEWVEPLYPQPEGSLSILDFGAIANDGQDDSGAILACIAEAAKQGKEVFLPTGMFEVSNPVLVQGIWLSQKGTVIRGAGMWHTTLTGPYAYFTFKNSGIALRDFSLIGRADLRRDTFPTAITSDFRRFDLRNIDVCNVWVEHYNIGLWVNCIDSLHITGCRFRNTYADGVNLRRGTSNSIVEQCDFRNNGDDGIAQWSAAVSDRNNKIRFNTVSLPWLANNIAVYGGTDIEITDNLLRDTVSFGGGVNISTKFDPQPFAGVIRVARNTFERTGSRDWDIPKDYGAIWINTVEGFDNEATLIIQDNMILDSGYHGICFTGGGRVADVRVEGNRVQGVALQSVYIDPPVRGQLRFWDNEGMTEPDGSEGSEADLTVEWEEPPESNR